MNRQEQMTINETTGIASYNFEHDAGEFFIDLTKDDLTKDMENQTEWEDSYTFSKLGANKCYGWSRRKKIKSFHEDGKVSSKNIGKHKET